ncbi:Cyclic di-GMP phosphodiesterase response regulator RpfG [Roseimaritima multifibrata]|uniref:Cyclic di-GMP phosphodiesterase response regulator RpfG n=1 Tax=Roseimaritima multifibrata TaxID=1930274 RepID=A0A517MM48_9BACT|nr:HD-GYP domain-containing protein [Roseimaritima multifibrata]QDS95930.1 Cyclic di-GMP phosphodiesterase response regulator RpfG [Roseimaritima multifibrata]
MTAPHYMLPAASLLKVQELREALRQQFDSRFSMWMVCDGVLESVEPLPESHAQIQHDLLDELFSREPLLSGVHIETVDGIDWVVQAVANEADEVIWLVGQSKQDRHQLLRRMAESTSTSFANSQALIEAKTCLAEYADQVTNDFEELAWLRLLAEHIEVCDLRSSLESVCAHVLPPLRQLVNAEFVALLSYPQDPSGQLIESNLECSYSLGELKLDLEFWAKQVGAVDVRSGNPFVRNSSPFANRETPLGSGETGIRNYILVPICRAGHTFGWLMVANRAVMGSNAQDLRVNATCLSGWEFGTFEAGVVNAAAIMLGTHAWNLKLYHEREMLLLGVVRSLINAVDAKDAYTCGHSDRVAAIGQQIARQMDLDTADCERIYMAGLLHDLGKIGVPDEVLSKPGRLTDEEYESIQQHPQIGYSILQHVKQLEYVLPGVLHHHESFDGSGYPQGLTGDSIPLFGRVLAVADAFDAMTSTRSYRKAMPVEKAHKILREGAGQQWDPDVVKAFFQASPAIEAICDQPDPLDQANELSSRLMSNPLESIDAISAAVSALERLNA